MKLHINGVSKSYGKSSVLKDIHIEIEKASAIGIIGESGCGKSTLLRQIAGIEEPDTGEIVINGISPVNDKKVFQENIGYVFQKHNLFPHLTIRENILLILEKIKRLDKREAGRITDAVLRQMFLEGEADKLPDEVSGGQAQRASIARALSTDPQLIFLDEPTAALDPVLTNEVLKAVTGLKKDGRDFIFVTHEIAFLREFADYVIFLKGGRICEHGGVSCLLSPQTSELADFLRIY